MTCTSFPVPCPCTKCRGTVRELIQHFDGKWYCPVSNECVVEKKAEEKK